MLVHLVFCMWMCSLGGGSRIQNALRGGSASLPGGNVRLHDKAFAQHTAEYVHHVSNGSAHADLVKTHRRKQHRQDHNAMDRNAKSSSKLGVKAERNQRVPKHNPEVHAVVERALNRWKHDFIKGAARIRRERAPRPESASELSAAHNPGTYHFIASFSGATQGKGFETLSYCRQCLCDVGLAAHKDCVYQLETVDWEKLPASKLDYLAICVANVPCCDCAACDKNWGADVYPRDKEKGLQCSDACDKCNAMEEPGSTEDSISKEDAEEMHPGPDALEVWKVHLAGNVAVQFAEENCIPPDEEEPTEFQDWIGNKLTCLMKMVGPARAYHCACEEDHSGACSKKDGIVNKAEMKEWEVKDGPTTKELIEGSFSGGEGSGWFCNPPGKFSVMGSELFEDMDPVMDEIMPIIAEQYAAKQRKRIKEMGPDDANAVVKKMSPEEAKLVSVDLVSEGLIEQESEEVENDVKKMLESAGENNEKAAKIVEVATEKKEKADAKYQDAEDLKAESKFANEEAEKLEREIKRANTKVDNMEAEAKSLEQAAKKLDKKGDKLEKEAEKLEEKIEEKKESVPEGEDKVQVLESLEKDGQVQAKTEVKAKFAHEDAEKKEKAAEKMAEKADDAEQKIDKAQERLDDAEEDSVEMAKEAEKKKEESEKLTKAALEKIQEAEDLSNEVEKDMSKVAEEIANHIFEASDEMPKDDMLNKVEFAIAKELVMNESEMKEAFKGGFAMVVLDTNKDDLVSKQEMIAALTSKLNVVLKAEMKDP